MYAVSCEVWQVAGFETDGEEGAFVLPPLVPIENARERLMWVRIGECVGEWPTDPV
jgi:hypothetical protein